MNKNIGLFIFFFANFSIGFGQLKMEWVCPISEGTDVLFTGNEFVALSNGSVITSPDGTVWTRHCSGTMESIAYGLDGFVAFWGANNESMCGSQDGRNWKRLETVPYGALSGLADITFGNNAFVAVTTDGKVFLSSDRLNWNVVYKNTSVPGGYFRSAAFGNGLFVVVGYSTSRGCIVLTSPDGTNWTLERNVPAMNLKSITYGNSRFVAAGRGGCCISSDGKTWESASLPDGFSGDYAYVGFANDSYYLFSTYYDGNFSSTDGLTWKPLTNLSIVHNTLLSSIAYGKNRYVAVGGAVLTSENGKNWVNLSSLHTTENILSITFNGEMFLASTEGSSIISSINGRDWDEIGNEKFVSMAYGNGRFVGVASFPSSGKLASSVDGKTWVAWADDSLINLISSVTFGNGKFVAVENGLSYMSLDGESWTKVDMSPSVINIYSVRFANGLFIACGDSILTSTDGLTWTTVNSVGPVPWKLIGYGNNTFVGITKGSSQIYTSKDLLQWNIVVSDDEYCLDGTFGYGCFVIVGKNGCFLTSEDGVTWTKTGRVNQSFRAVTCGLNRFVAVGEYGNIAVAAADKPESVRFDVPFHGSEKRFKTIFANNVLSVFLPSGLKAEPLHARIYNVLGRMVYDCKLPPGGQIAAISANGLKKGMYVISIEDGVSVSMAAEFIVAR